MDLESKLESERAEANNLKLYSCWGMTYLSTDIAKEMFQKMKMVVEKLEASKDPNTIEAIDMVDSLGNYAADDPGPASQILQANYLLTCVAQRYTN